MAISIGHNLIQSWLGRPEVPSEVDVLMARFERAILSWDSITMAINLRIQVDEYARMLCWRDLHNAVRLFASVSYHIALNLVQELLRQLRRRHRTAPDNVPRLSTIELGE